ncbi:DUF2528 family protein [Chitinimonas sp.]|uniref:DUF2528 family protein n=1 Tax=Chitinimonas sp. TaxID=1934313 RepID=UPI0035B0A94B
MTIRRYEISAEFWSHNASLVVEFDDEKFPLTTFEEINRFWSGDQSRLDLAGGNVVVAVLRMLAMRTWTDHDFEADLEAGRAEGWPQLGRSAGFRICHVDMPEIESADVEVVEVAL